MRRPLRSAALPAAVVLLGVPLSVPAFVWEHAGRIRYSFEYGLLVLAVVAAARTRGRVVVRRAAIVLYFVLLLFLTYEGVFRASFRQEPALVEDFRLAINLVHFLWEVKSWRWLAFALGGAALVTALFVALDKVLRRLQESQAAARLSRIPILAAAWALVGVTSALLHGPIRAGGVEVAANVRASIAARKRLEALGDATHDERYRDFAKVRLAKRPNFYFLVVEAYGEILVTWDMTEPYRALMQRARGRLESAGYHMRTMYSTATIHGGRSWLSLATMQTGIPIDQPELFEVFEAQASHVPTLVGFFRQQGYHTASIEPGTKDRTGVGKNDLYGHEMRVDAPALAYGGKSWGFGGIPDQYTLDQFRARFVGPLGDPRYVFYMAVSTHYPWTDDTVPMFEGDSSDWPPLPGTEKIGTDLRRYYLKSVDYEWHLLTKFLETETSPEIVIVILGDHQPRLESNVPGEVTFNTPVHVISRDKAFVDRFATVGFQEGLYAEPGSATPIVHEALFSLLVSELAGAYGTEETKAFAHYFPEGISLRGLNP